MSLYIFLTRLAVWSSSNDVDPLLPRFWPRIWVSKFCVGSVTSSILLLVVASHLPRLRCPPCDVALLLRFCLLHWALVWLSHLVHFCDVALLLRLLPDAGNESVTFFHVVRFGWVTTTSSGDVLLSLRVWLALARNFCTDAVTFFVLLFDFEPVVFLSLIRFISDECVASSPFKNILPTNDATALMIKWLLIRLKRRCPFL